MSKTNFIHALKGPERLSPDVVKNIVESRGIPKARSEMAKKHGISEARIGRLWVEYYGGGKLSDFKSGIKKPLPTEPINNADITIRHLKTERGEYKAREPKIEKIDPKIDARRRAKPTKIYKPTKDLILNESAVDQLSDRDAEIICGEIGAGNNNAELLQVFDQLIQSRDRDTTYLYKLAKKGLKKNYDTDYDYNSIDETDNDDSTAVYKQKSKLPEEEYNSKYERGYDSRDSRKTNPIEQFSNSTSPSMVLRNDTGRRPEEFSGRDSRNYSQTTTTGTRAQPVYCGYREDATVRKPQQSHISESSRYESQISPTEYNSSQGCIQPNNTYNSNQCIPKSEQGNGVSRESRSESCQSVPGLPWLRIKPY